MGDHDADETPIKKSRFVVPKWIDVTLADDSRISFRWLTSGDADSMHQLVDAATSSNEFAHQLLRQQVKDRDIDRLDTLTDDEFGMCLATFAGHQRGLQHQLNGQIPQSEAFLEAAQKYRAKWAQIWKDLIRVSRSLDFGIGATSVLLTSASQSIFWSEGLTDKLERFLAPSDWIVDHVSMGSMLDAAKSAQATVSLSALDAVEALSSQLRLQLDDAASLRISELASVAALSLSSLGDVGLGSAGLAAAISPMDWLTETLPDFSRFIEDTSEELSQFEQEFQNHPFGYSFMFWEAAFTYEMLQGPQVERDDAMRAHAIKVSQRPEFCDELLNHISSDSRLERRLGAVTAGVEDHLAGRFWTSVPTLIAQCEGLLNDITIEFKLGWLDGINVMRADNGGKMAGMQEKAQTIASRLADCLSRTLVRTMENQGSTLLLRNGVLHGTMTDYNTLENSSTAVLTLATLVAAYTKYEPNPQFHA